MEIHFCPKCDRYSGNCINVIQKGIDPDEEVLECVECEWIGKWNEMKIRIKLPLENLLDHLLALNEDERIKLFKNFCVHCGTTITPCYCSWDDQLNEIYLLLGGEIQINKELDSEFMICQFVNNYKFKQFSLGICFVSSPIERLPVGLDYSILNTDEHFEVVRSREYYLSLYLGFWQLHIGFRTR